MSVPAGLLSWLAHEIATPLNSIRILAEMLEANRSGALGETELRYTASLQRAAGELNRLLEDLSLLGRILDGRVLPRADLVATEQWAARLRDAYLPRAREANVVLTVEVAPGAFTPLRIDVSLCTRLLDPIVARAIAVSPGGEVLVGLARSARGGVRVSVADNGPPVASGEEAGLFEPFRRDLPSRGRNPDMGLGLMIARELARLLGGALSADSAAAGMTICVELPATSS